MQVGPQPLRQRFASGGGSNGWEYGAFLKHEIDPGAAPSGTGSNKQRDRDRGERLERDNGGGASNLLLNFGAQIHLVDWGKLLLGIGARAAQHRGAQAHLARVRGLAAGLLSRRLRSPWTGDRVSGGLTTLPG